MFANGVLATTQLQGRFSGRLAEKADEQRLVSECAALGPLLGESQPQTLSTLVRGIATGKVRKFLEDHLPAPGTETQVHPPAAAASPHPAEVRYISEHRPVLTHRGIGSSMVFWVIDPAPLWWVRL